MYKEKEKWYEEFMSILAPEKNFQRKVFSSLESQSEEATTKEMNSQHHVVTKQLVTRHLASQWSIDVLPVVSEAPAVVRGFAFKFNVLLNDIHVEVLFIHNIKN